MVRRLAVQKAVATAAKLKFRPSLVIGSDTVVFYKGKIYGKPMSPRYARVMLMKLSGKTHQVYTGVAVVNSMNLKVASAVDMARVTFRKIDPREALKIGKKHLDKAGSYAYQDDSDKLVVKVSGDWQTVVGLPLRVLKRLLEKSRNYSDT